MPRQSESGAPLLSPPASLPKTRRSQAARDSSLSLTLKTLPHRSLAHW